MLNRKFKKTMAVITAAALCFTAAAPVQTVSAKAKTVKVTYSIANGNEWILEPTTLKVSADLDDKYADVVGYTDNADEPTMLDATIAAHIAAFGEKNFGFAAAASDGGSGWITCAAKDYSVVGYDINDENPADMLDAKLAKGDGIRLFIYTDTVAWTDTYVFFDKTSVKAKKGTKQKLTLTAYYNAFDENWNAVKTPAAGLSVTYNGKVVGTTNKKGKVSFKVGKNGIVSAEGTIGDAQIVKPYCVVKKAK